MASEELQQKYPKNTGFSTGRFELFETQLTTLNQYAKHGIIPNLNFGKYKTQKCDAIVIERSPTLRVVAIGETKSPGELTKSKWEALLKDLFVTKMQPTNALLGYLTDGIKTWWVASGPAGMVLVSREDKKAMPVLVDFTDPSFVADFNHIVDYVDPKSGLVRIPDLRNPEALAKEVWQTVWRLQADRPEDCLATFVEIFIYKFLDDLQLMKTNSTGVDVSFDNLFNNVSKDQSFVYYNTHVRPHIKFLFPEGADGLSVINGTVLQASNRDHNIIFHEILKKFYNFGSLRDTSPEFKTRLYESFLQESKTTTTFGQHFTPRTVVSAIHDMAEVDKVTGGQKICDPASGVGGFLLEQMARDLDSQWACSGNAMTPTHEWHAFDIVPKTTILAKANALVHCGDLLANQPGRLPAFVSWLNSVFVCKNKTAFGSLEDMSKDVYDLILTNPPFVVSGSADINKLIKADNKRKTYFARKYSGLEGLFIQFIVQALKVNGSAWVILPETFYLRSTDRELREWLFKTCRIDLLVALPERTFFNTPKRVVIAHLVKRSNPISDEKVLDVLKKEDVLLFAVSEIGETRDAKRFKAPSDLPELVDCYRKHKAGVAPTTKRAVVVSASELYRLDSINIRHHWKSDVARELGLLGAEEDPLETKREIDNSVKSIQLLAKKWEEAQADLTPPPIPKATIKVPLCAFDTSGKPLPVQPLFDLRIGKRVLKKEIHDVRSGFNLYSANVRKSFGYVETANAGNLPFGGVLWSIDSDFDCRGVSPGDLYSITDHCGQITIKVPDIDPDYLAAQIKQVGIDYGFNREFRPSLDLMRKMVVEIPVDEDKNFDLNLMVAWSDFRRRLDMFKMGLSKLLD